MAQVPPAAVLPVVPYVPLVGDTVVADGFDENNAMAQILHWIGFRTEVDRTAIYEDALSSFTDAKVLNESDISDMVKDFNGRTQITVGSISNQKEPKGSKVLFIGFKTFTASQRI